MNILVVDDEKVQIETLRRALRSKGYQVFEALNAIEALDQLESMTYRIDMVLTDYIMPGKDGIELLKKIREKYGELPVIIMTAYGEKEMLIDALRNRCDGFIEKPFNVDQLIGEIERVMKKFD
ncbi:MAG: response regulator [Desulfobacterales bacterium]|nr:response regulator [Desulfobacterales bacterium]